MRSLFLCSCLKRSRFEGLVPKYPTLYSVQKVSDCYFFLEELVGACQLTARYWVCLFTIFLLDIQNDGVIRVVLLLAILITFRRNCLDVYGSNYDGPCRCYTFKRGVYHPASYVWT